MDTTGMIIRMIGALAIILGLLSIALYGMRRWGAKLQGDRSDLIQVISTRMILPRKHVSVVRVGKKHLVIGTSENSMTLLATMDPETEPGVSKGNGVHEESSRKN